VPLDRVLGPRLDACGTHRDGRCHPPCVPPFAGRESPGEFRPQMHRLEGSHDAPGAGSLMPSLAVQIRAGTFLWAGSPWHRCWSGRRKGGSAMRKVMESLMLLLARIRKVITGQR